MRISFVFFALIFGTSALASAYGDDLKTTGDAVKAFYKYDLYKYNGTNRTQTNGFYSISTTTDFQFLLGNTDNKSIPQTYHHKTGYLVFDLKDISADFEFSTISFSTLTTQSNGYSDGEYFDVSLSYSFFSTLPQNDYTFVDSLNYIDVGSASFNTTSGTLAETTITLSQEISAGGRYLLIKFDETRPFSFGDWHDIYLKFSSVSLGSASIPESSTFAVIFGAFAFALAIYLRRK